MQTGQNTAGMIVETEAYNGAEDKACHAFDADSLIVRG